MTQSIDMQSIKNYFSGKLETYGTTPRGVDWNSETSQELRFEQLAKIIATDHYSLLDYGSGFGSFYDYLVKKGHQLKYTGFDIVEGMVQEGYKLHPNDPNCQFSSQLENLAPCDYTIASGIFNIKLDVEHNAWTDYVLGILNKINDLSTRGFSFNLLTSYSDPEYMRTDLYYADPCFYFDYCKRHFAKNVAILHDYGLYDFTVLVRKQL